MYGDLKTTTKTRTRRGSGTMQFLMQEELKRLLAVIKDKRDKALFLLAYRHGLRASEIGLLQRTDVDLKQGRITIHRLKGSLSGIYPLQPDVIKLLRTYLRVRTDASPISSSPTAACPSIGVRCGARCRPMARRRACRRRNGSSIASSTPSPPTSSTRAENSSFVQDWVGHKNVQNTTKYAQLTNPRRDEEARKLFADHQWSENAQGIGFSERMCPL